MRASQTCGIISLLLLICMAAAAQEQTSRNQDYERGKLDARSAINQGIYLIKKWGLESPSIGGAVCGTFPSRENFYKSVLKKEYGISYESSAGCIVGKDEVDYFTGYNDETRTAVLGKYGLDFFARVRRNADEEFDRKYGEKESGCANEQAEFLKSIKGLPTRQPN